MKLLTPAWRRIRSPQVSLCLLQELEIMSQEAIRRYVQGIVLHLERFIEEVRQAESLGLKVTETDDFKQAMARLLDCTGYEPSANHSVVHHRSNLPEILRYWFDDRAVLEYFMNPSNYKLGGIPKSDLRNLVPEGYVGISESKWRRFKAKYLEPGNDEQSPRNFVFKLKDEFLRREDA